MSRLFIRFISLVHGILAASAWAGVTAAAGAVRACIPASYRHFAPFLRTARVLLVVFGFGFGSLAFAQTASFSYAIVTLGGGFSSPNGVAVDGSGNVYAADWSNSAVKKMPAGCASSNCVTTLGGGFSYPTGVAVDGSGNVYVADRLNNAVKEMPAGCVSSSCVTALGGGFNHPTGVAVDRSGNVYVADSYNAAVKEIPAGCASLSCVTTLGGGFTTPNGVAVDGIGNVYVADAGNDAVKEMPTGCSLSTCVTKLGGGFLDPWGVAVDGSGNVYVADTNNNAVKEMPSGCASSGCVITLGGGFNLPLGVALDGSGNVYVGDGGHGAVKEIMAGAVNFYTVPVGTSSAATALTFTFDSAGSLGSTTPYQVLTQGATNLDFNAAATQESNACNGSTAYTAGESCTVDVIFTPEFPGPRYGAVVLESSSGVVATAYLQGTGTGPQVNFLPGTQSVIAIAVINKTEPSAWGVAVDGSGNVYISELDNDLVLKETLSAGTYTQTVIANNASNGLSDPTGVAVDGSGSVYIADTNNDRVLKEAPSAGGYTQSVVANYANNGLGVNGQEGPNGVAVDGSGNVYIADTVNSRVLKETLSAGTYTQSVVANSATNGLIEPLGVAVDGSGNVYIADTDSIRVLKETPSASTYTQSVVANSATNGLNYPVGVAVDGNGNVYIADRDLTNATNSRVLKETQSSGSYIQSVVATTFAPSAFSYPSAVAVDGSGNVYIVDFSNYRVLKEDFADPPSLTFASTQVGQTSSDSPQTVTLQNYGNTALTFPVPASGNDPSISANFALNNSEEPACPLVSAGSTAGVLAAGASCLLPISFTPATTGSFDGALTLTDNNLNAASPNYAVQSIRLIGATPGLPIITSVSAILPQQTQTITINGSGFGTHSPYKGDSNFIALSDTTGNHFTAGYTGNAIGLGVSSWTDTQIVLTSLTGGYGTNGWCIRPGDQLEVRVWNAGTSDGPAVYPLVATGTDTCAPVITSVSPIGSAQTQTITITGSGFGSHSPYNGDSNFIALSDTTGNHFTAGYTGNAIGLGVSSWTDTQIVLTSLTGGYGTNGWCIRPGDQLEVKVWNAGTSGGPAVYPIVATITDTCAPVITSVSPIGSAQTQTITITGSGFGSHSPYNGDSNFIALSDTTGNHFTAGYTGNAIGLDVSSWTNTQIVLTSLTGGYGTNGWCIRPGDQLDVRVWNVGTSGGPAIYPLVATGTNTCP